MARAHRSKILICAAMLLLAQTAGAPLIAPALAASNPVLSGQTQVIAKVGTREITISELRMEMARLNLNPAEQSAQKAALTAIIDRIVFAQEARRHKVDRKPEAMWRMETAREQALAEVYADIIAQPPEPTQADIRQFMQENPSLFADAKSYDFQVIEFETGAVAIEEVTPLFDETDSFNQFAKHLAGKNIPYTLSPAKRAAATFPKPIREQLAKYGVRDNIVLEGDERVTVMKIMAITPEPLNYKEGASLARLMLRQERSDERVQNKLEALRAQSGVTYYREHLKPGSDSAAQPSQNKAPDNAKGIQ